MFWNKMKRKFPNNTGLEENAIGPIGYGVSWNENIYDIEINNISTQNMLICIYFDYTSNNM